MPLPPGYVPVVTRKSKLAHLRHPEFGFACSNGRAIEKRGFPWRPAPDMPLCPTCERRQQRPRLSSIAGRKPPPWNIAIREMLADGEWHEIADLARRGGATIPPNKAMAWFIQHVAPPRSAEWAAGMSTREKIRRGRYNLCIRVITDWITERVVEADRPPRRKGRQVRLVANPRPGPRCRDEKGRYAR